MPLIGGAGAVLAMPKMTNTAAVSAGFIWHTATVDSNGDHGTHASIAFHPTSGIPWISYYDEENQDLMVAHRVSSGGNCGPNQEWYCETVDSAGDVGRYSSIDVAPLSIWKVGVAYYDTSSQALKFAEYICALGSCSWSVVTIEAGGGTSISYGLYPSLKYDSNGNPNIAYYINDPSVSDALRFAYRVSSAGNCGQDSAAGKWRCYTVDSGEGVGQFASMELTYAATLLIPYVAYYDKSKGDLKLAKYVGGSGGTGCTHVSWSCQMIDGASTDVGQQVSFELTNGQYFAYYDATNAKLKFAYRVWAGEGNCGGGDFRCVSIESAAPLSNARSISLAVDSTDHPLIAYRHTQAGNSHLRVAQPIEAVGSSSGNCGPLNPGSIASWQCLSIETESSALEDIATDVSVAFDPQDMPMVAYSRNGLTISGDDHDLKIAYRRIGIFLPIVLK
jgi:hypothetical protein